MGKRQYAQKEWRLLSWWLVTYHRGAEIHMNVRVGPTRTVAGATPDDGAERSMVRVRNRWADAIYLENGVVHLVEAKVEPDPGIFSVLLHYARKLRSDPTYAAWKQMPLELVALVYHDDPSLAEEAPWYRVRWVVYQPDLSVLPPAMIRGSGIIGAEVPLPQDFPARLDSWGIEALSGEK